MRNDEVERNGTFSRFLLQFNGDVRVEALHLSELEGLDRVQRQSLVSLRMTHVLSAVVKSSVRLEDMMNSILEGLNKQFAVPFKMQPTFTEALPLFLQLFEGNAVFP